MTDGLFSPFTVYDGLCTIAILIGSMIAAGGGLGGGGVFVPIYILILSLPTSNATALSQATIFGGSIVNLLMNWKQSHPKRKHRPLTDFPTLLVFEPMLLVGTIIGVLLNVIFPDILILILLIVTLIYATVRTTRKGVKMWNKESLELQSRGQRNNGYITGGHSINTGSVGTKTTINSTQHEHGYDTNDSLLRRNSNEYYDDTNEEDGTLTEKALIQLTQKSNNNDNNQMDTDLIDINSDTQNLLTKNDRKYGSFDDETISFNDTIWEDMALSCGVETTQLDTKKIGLLKPLIDQESKKWIPMLIILIIWIISSVTSIGKTQSISGVVSCTAIYWLCEFISFPVMIAISLYFTRREFNQFNEKLSTGAWLPAFGDIEWNKSMFNIAKYPLIATIAGILGGLLGIGGGMIVSPLLMELGVIPMVAAATSAMAVLITSSSATLQYFLLGYLDIDYTLYFMSIGIIGTFLGQTVVSYCIKKYGRKSLIVFSVAAIMGGAVLLMGIDGILALVDGISWTFSTPC